VNRTVVDSIFKRRPNLLLYPGRENDKRSFPERFGHVDRAAVVAYDHVAVVHDRDKRAQIVTQ
jgi:hypothetical protein